MKTEKLITFANWNRKEGEFHFEVPSDWLDTVIEEIVTADNFENVEEHIISRKNHLYDQLSDRFFTNDILSYAIEDGIVNADGINIWSDIK